MYWIVNLVDRQVEVYEQLTGASPSPTFGQQRIDKSGDAVAVVLGGATVGTVAVTELLLCVLVFLEELDGVAEDLQTVAFGLKAVAGPVRVLRGKEVPVRVWHQTHRPAGRVADAGDVVL